MTDPEGNEIGKLFVGGLSQATNGESLRVYFTLFGELEDAVVMMDNKTGRSRGFGYVKYKNHEAVKCALEGKPHILDGKEVDAKQCNVNMKGRNRRSLKVFVGGIGLDQDVKSLTKFFEQFGNVTDVNLMMDSNKQRHRGFAFVGFDDEIVVNRLINMHYITMNNKQVEIKAMEPPNFGRKNGSFINSQHEHEQYHKENGMSHMQASNSGQLFMQQSQFHNYHNNQYDCNSNLNTMAYGPVFPGSTFSNGYTPENLNHHQNLIRSQDGRIMNEQYQNPSVTYAGIDQFISGNYSVPLVISNGYVPISPAVYGSLNSSNALPFVTCTNNSQFGSGYQYQIISPQLQSPNEYWPTNSVLSVSGLQQNPPNLTFPHYINPTNGTGCQQQILSSIQNPYYGMQILSNAVSNKPCPLSSFNSMSTQDTNQTSENLRNPDSDRAESLPGGERENIDVVVNPRTSITIKEEDLQGSNPTYGDENDDDVYTSANEQCQPKENPWYSQLAGVSMQFINNQLPAWSLQPNITPEIQIRNASTQLVSSENFPNRELREENIQNENGAITQNKSRQKDLMEVTARPSGDHPDVCVDEQVDRKESKSKESAVEGKDMCQTVQNKETNKISSRIIREVQIPNHNSTNWPYNVNQNLSNQCFADNQNGYLAQSFGPLPGLILQPNIANTAWTGLPNIYDSTMSYSTPYRYMQNCMRENIKNSRSISTVKECTLQQGSIIINENEEKPHVSGMKTRSLHDKNDCIQQNRRQEISSIQLDKKQRKDNKMTDNSHCVCTHNSSDRHRSNISKDGEIGAINNDSAYKNHAGAAGDNNADTK